MKCVKRRTQRPSKSERRAPELYPGAVFFDDLSMMKPRGDMKPEMIVIHFTAGWQNGKGRDAVKEANKNGYGYLFLEETGQVIQQCNLEKWYYHAGKSEAPEFTTMAGKNSLSKVSIGIEVACGGKLEFKNGAYRTWYNHVVPESNRREVSSRDGYIHSGTYQKYTDNQEKSLIELCTWLCKRFGISTQNIVGHDEIAPNRKNDPGGALSCSMPRFRQIISSKLLEEIEEFGAPV